MQVQVKDPDSGKISRPFEGICASVRENWADWKAWINHDDPVHAALPEPFQSSLQGFFRLVAVKAFRDDQLVFALQDYVAREMGAHLAESPTANMEDVFNDLDNKTPCIFILSKVSFI